ncbi:MAG TPA: hypothetical protein VGG29_05270 [Caulobacteraceae bacterium]
MPQNNQQQQQRDACTVTTENAALAAGSAVSRGPARRADLHALGWRTGASRAYMAKMREGVKAALTARDAQFGDYRTGAKAE